VVYYIEINCAGLVARSLASPRFCVAPGLASGLFAQIIMALRYLHKEKRIVHRDLTPNNIMVTHGNKVTISKYMSVLAVGALSTLCGRQQAILHSHRLS